MNEFQRKTLHCWREKETFFMIEISNEMDIIWYLDRCKRWNAKNADSTLSISGGATCMRREWVESNGYGILHVNEIIYWTTYERSSCKHLGSVSVGLLTIGGTTSTVDPFDCRWRLMTSWNSQHTVVSPKLQPHKKSSHSNWECLCGCARPLKGTWELDHTWQIDAAALLSMGGHFPTFWSFCILKTSYASECVL